MANPQAAELEAALRMLPSTDEVLMSKTVRSVVPEIGRTRAASMVRLAIDLLRTELAESVSKGAGRDEAYTKESLLLDASRRFSEIWNRHQASGVRKVINATGVVIHTNLGRAPLSTEAIRAMTDAAGYCTLEYDLETGKRGKRGDYLESLLAEATGAEAALVVNNCAAAAYLVLTVATGGGEAIVSRGELVEIGGDFRVPDVLSQSGATLKEVGTTNRTKLSDYEKAIEEETKVILRVHPSNYKIIGFTDKPSLGDLAKLSAKKGLLLYEDAGSGALLDMSKFGLTDEPIISRSIADGADIVTFSGDKLLGGAQAGIIVGRKSLIEQMRRHPLYRALRVSKLIYAALEATVESYVNETAETSIPVLKMLGLTTEEVGNRTRKLAERLASRLRGTQVEIISGESVVGGGSAPGTHPATVLLAIRDTARSSPEIDRRLRMGEVPVISRIEDDRILIDLRTVDEGDEERLIEMLVAALA